MASRKWVKIFKSVSEGEHYWVHN